MAEGVASGPPAARLSLADQVFVNFMAALACNRIEDRKRRKLARDVAAEVLPQVTRGHHYLDPILAAFAALERAQDDPSVSRGVELLALSSALSDFFQWRGALALDALRESRGQERRAKDGREAGP